VYNANDVAAACPPNPALGGTAFFDLKSAPGEFNNNGRVTFGGDGATFTISKTGEYATMKSKFYIMYGHVELVLRTAKGKGMVTSAHLQSDVLDEIDWEWLGGDPTQVLSNYFRLGKTETYDRGAYHPNPGNQDGFHTYSFDWTSDRIQWAIDGQVVRELTRAAAGSNYPQTPMNLHLGPWSGGDAAANPEGTVSKLWDPVSSP
jgi:beta-glucanase (GH16 family)